jgi:mRNA interferase HigB
MPGSVVQIHLSPPRSRFKKSSKFKNPRFSSGARGFFVLGVAADECERINAEYLNLRYIADMRVISNKALVDFSAIHGDAEVTLQAWRKVVDASSFQNLAELKAAFNATDKVGNYTIFDIGGNKYRIVAAIHFDKQKLFVRHVFTHKEYDKWKP